MDVNGGIKRRRGEEGRDPFIAPWLDTTTAFSHRLRTAESTLSFVEEFGIHQWKKKLGKKEQQFRKTKIIHIYTIQCTRMDEIPKDSWGNLALFLCFLSSPPLCYPSVCWFVCEVVFLPLLFLSQRRVDQVVARGGNGEAEGDGEYKRCLSPRRKCWVNCNSTKLLLPLPFVSPYTASKQRKQRVN